jgi:hypothetical protein
MNSRLSLPFLIGVTWSLASQSAFPAKLKPETLSVFERYIELTENRRQSELESDEGFLFGDFLPSPGNSEFQEQIRSGNIFIQKMETLDEEGKTIKIPDGMVHHWYGAVFVPGVELSDVLTWAQNYSDNHQYYEEVEDSQLISREEDLFRIYLRLKRKKVITVHYNTEHEVVYTTHAEDRASSHSRSTKVAEIENPGTSQEREKHQGNDRGFLWRLNSYWRFQQRDGGVVVDCETVSLSRSIPTAMTWMVKSYLESVPRESLARTLEPIRRELARGEK